MRAKVPEALGFYVFFLGPPNPKVFILCNYVTHLPRKRRFSSSMKRVNAEAPYSNWGTNFPPSDGFQAVVPLSPGKGFCDLVKDFYVRLWEQEASTPKKGGG